MKGVDMVPKPGTQYLIALALLASLSVTLSCSDSSEPTVPEDFNIVGSWNLTALERAFGNYNSSFVFASSGTYQWAFFSDVLALDVAGGGSYSLDGNMLTIDGSAPAIIGLTRLTLSASGNSFSFRDADGDRWTYTRR